MKKLMALLLAVIMVFAFTGCNNEDIEAGPDSTDRWEDTDVVNEVNMIYGDDETSITLYKPSDASFTTAPDSPEDTEEIVTLCADDFSWDAEIMGYKYYEGIGSNVPFVDYYFCGSVVSEDYESYEQEVTDLGIDYEGKPVKLIRYTFKEAGDDEEYKECFVGFEYKGADDQGLFGIIIGAFDEEPSDNYIKGLFSEVFTPER